MLPEDLFHHVQGTTDSEACFMLFLHYLITEFADPAEPGKLRKSYAPQELKTAVINTIKCLSEWSKEYQTEEPSTMNFVVTDGNTVVATRFIDHPTKEPASLYFASGSKFECAQESRDYKMIQGDRRQFCHIIASEPLTDGSGDWVPVPRNNVLIITPDSNLLIFPIKDW